MCCRNFRSWPFLVRLDVHSFYMERLFSQLDVQAQEGPILQIWDGQTGTSRSLDSRLDQHISIRISMSADL